MDSGKELKVCRGPNNQWKLASSEEEVPDGSHCTAKQLFANSTVEDKLDMMVILKKDLEATPSQVVLSHVVDEEGTKKPYDIYESEGKYSSWHSSNGNARMVKKDFKCIQYDMALEIYGREQLPDEHLSDFLVRGFLDYMGNKLMRDNFQYVKDPSFEDPVVKSHIDASVIQKFLNVMQNKFNGLTRAQFDQINTTVIRRFNARAARHKEVEHIKLVLERALDHGVVTLQQQEEESDVDETWNDYVADHEANCDHSLDEQRQDFINFMSGGYHQQQALLDYMTQVSKESNNPPSQKET